MHMWRNKLVLKIALFQPYIEIRRDFIVENIHLWLVAGSGQMFMNVDPSSDFGSRFIFEGTVQNSVAVIIINNE
jgi:hypothetical protein